MTPPGWAVLRCHESASHLRPPPRSEGILISQMAKSYWDAEVIAPSGETTTELREPNVLRDARRRRRPPRTERSPPRLGQSIQRKIQRLQEGIWPSQQQSWGLSRVRQVMQQFEPLIDKGKLQEANAVLDCALEILE